MAELETGWVFADAWVLAAIGTRGYVCSLVELIAAADMINHAIPLEAEVESALTKLAGAGLVRVYEGWTFELTEEGSSLWGGGDGALIHHVQLMVDQLSDFEPGRRAVRFPRGLMEQAVAEYRDGSTG